MNDTLVSKKMRRRIKNLVLREYNKCSIHTIPVDIISVMISHSIYSISFTAAMNAGLIPCSWSIDEFNGISFWKRGSALIVYNELHPITRKRWTIAHEIGHIVLGHKEQTDMAEAEANYFAKQLLMPLAVLDEMEARSRKEIAEMCNVSLEAAAFREKDFSRRNRFKARYGNTRHDIAFLKQFNMFQFADEVSL